MNTLLRKLVAITIIGACAVSSDTSAMQKFAHLYCRIFSNQQQSKKKQKSDYSINLMWINKERKEDQQFIHPSNDEFASTICKWAALNKNGVVNVWYDDEMTTPEAIKNTQQAIYQECEQYPDKAPVFLKNVRKLPEVKEHPKVFSDKMPIFFRVDLLRAIAGFNHVSRGKVNNFVYSDLDAEPMSEDELFDEKTQEQLKQYGMILTEVHPGSSGYENGFQIISNHKPNLLQAQKLALIDRNIELGNDTCTRTFPSWYGQQAVYYSYRSMFEHFYSLEGCGEFKDARFVAHEDWCKESRFSCDPLIPTKKVNIPPSEHFGSKKYNKKIN